MNKKIILISLANKPYFKFLEGCIKSSLVHYSNIFFEAYLVNPINEDIKYFKNISSRVNINVININFKNQMVSERDFCGNYRNFLLKKYSNEDAIVIWVDADCLFMKKSDEWLNLIYDVNYDVAVFQGKITTLSGIIVCNNNKKAKKFMVEYGNNYDPLKKYGNKKYMWFLDQDRYRIVLDKCIKEHGLIVKDLSFPIYACKITDPGLISQIHIWLPIREKKEKIFQDELDKYISINKV